MKNTNEAINGIIWILVGLLLLLKTLGILSFSILNILSSTWPLFLILIGLAFLYKKKELVRPLLSILLLLLVFGLFDAIVINEHNKLEFSQEVGLDKLNDKVLVKLEFGVGSINITSTNQTLYKNTGFAPSNEPNLNIVSEEYLTSIFVNRGDEDFVMGNGIKEEWNIELYDDIPLDIYIDYGVTDAYMNLTNLKVETFSIKSGVTDSKILFGKYPTKVKIDSGVSDISLSFAKNYPVRILVKTGISSNNLDDFTKENGYYTYNYDSDTKEFIDVTISGGVTDLNIEVRE